MVERPEARLRREADLVRQVAPWTQKGTAGSSRASPIDGVQKRRAREESVTAPGYSSGKPYAITVSLIGVSMKWWPPG